MNPYFLFPLLSLLFFSFGLESQSLLESKTSTTRAVVIGISEYEHESIPDLFWADDDAWAFIEFLQSPAGGNIPIENIHPLINEEATTGKITTEIGWLLSESKKGDRAIIYFSGHADVERLSRNQRGYLLTHQSKYPWSSGSFDITYLQDLIGTLSDKEVQVIMISDACRVGKLAVPNINGPGLASGVLAQQLTNEVKILSCQSNQLSIETREWGKQGGGIFTHFLIQGLSGKADQPEYGAPDGEVSLLELSQYLRKEVPSWASPHKQTPLVRGDDYTVLSIVDIPSEEDTEEITQDAPPALSLINPRGFENALLQNLDTLWKEKYQAFSRALEEGALLEPSGTCAYDLYQELSPLKEFQALKGLMGRNLAAKLQDEALSAIEKYLVADVKEMADREKGDVKYKKYPLYLEKAIELLGNWHPYSPSLKAKQYYFEALNLRLQWWESINDSSIQEKRVELLEKAIDLQPNAAFLYNELGITTGDTTHYFKAIELAPAWGYPILILPQLLCIRNRKKRLNMPINA
jgi:hypothetical protein